MGPWEEVESSNISRVRHDPVKNALEVEFKTGARYRYDGVTAEAHGKLVNAESVGGHFAERVRGLYRGVRL